MFCHVLVSAFRWLQQTSMWCNFAHVDNCARLPKIAQALPWTYCWLVVWQKESNQSAASLHEHNVLNVIIMIRNLYLVAPWTCARRGGGKEKKTDSIFKPFICRRLMSHSITSVTSPPANRNIYLLFIKLSRNFSLRRISPRNKITQNTQINHGACKIYAGRSVTGNFKHGSNPRDNSSATCSPKWNHVAKATTTICQKGQSTFDGLCNVSHFTYGLIDTIRSVCSFKWVEWVFKRQVRNLIVQ